MSSTVRSLRPVAYHEAGHAVVQTALGIPYRSVYIRSTGEGLVVGTGEMLRLGRYEMENRIVGLLAGPYAEARATKKMRAWITTQQDDDYRCAVEMMEYIVNRMGLIDDMRDAHRRFNEYTREILTQHWNAVERVAAALIQHRELPPRAVAALSGLPLRIEDAR